MLEVLRPTSQERSETDLWCPRNALLVLLILYLRAPDISCPFSGRLHCAESLLSGADKAGDVHGQVLEEEKENLRKLEERVKSLAEEAAHAAEMEASLADAGGVTGVEGAAAAASALRERQREAEEKLARLRKAIEGPPQLEVCNSPGLARFRFHTFIPCTFTYITH